MPSLRRRGRVQARARHPPFGLREPQRSPSRLWYLPGIDMPSFLDPPLERNATCWRLSPTSTISARICWTSRPRLGASRGLGTASPRISRRGATPTRPPAPRRHQRCPWLLVAASRASGCRRCSSASPPASSAKLDERCVVGGLGEDVEDEEEDGNRVGGVPAPPWADRLCDLLAQGLGLLRDAAGRRCCPRAVADTGRRPAPAGAAGGGQSESLHHRCGGRRGTRP